MDPGFLSLSARVGANLRLVQGAGGNTSEKRDDVLWVKASGTWLCNADKEAIFVGLKTASVLGALSSKDPEALSPFLVEPSPLRPSIEALMHALLPHRIVVHVHSIATIALAVRVNGEEEVATCFKGLPWQWISYARPGYPLARLIQEKMRPTTSILVLQNHGLVVGAENSSAAEALLNDCESRLDQIPRKVDVGSADRRKAWAAQNSLRAAGADLIHSLACDAISLQHLATGVLYPDQAVFLGPQFAILEADDDLTSHLTEFRQRLGWTPPCVIVRGVGVFLMPDARRGVEEMLACHAMVLQSQGPTSNLRALGPEQVSELLNWDAEKYRQALSTY